MPDIAFAIRLASVKAEAPVGLILLAAGGSRRLGEPKQLLEFAGRTLLRRAVETAVSSCCRPVVVVLGAEAERCAAELQDLPVRIALNARWNDGMAGSVRAGLDALLAEEPNAAAAVLCLCDQPQLTAAVLDAITVAHLTTGQPIVASTYRSVLGAPALFAANRFAELRELVGDEGARRLFARHPDEVAVVPFPGGDNDVDTPADRTALLRNALANR